MIHLPKSQESFSRSFLRWAGSKKQILPILHSYWNSSHKRYVEPFAGSACLFFRIQPQKALLGDINQDLMATFREVKYRVPSVIDELAKLSRGKDAYIQIRRAKLDELSNSQKAARFIYLNRFCFNGLYRTNLKGEFNVPYGGEKAGDIPSADLLRDCSRRLRSARLIPGDFEKVLKKVRPGDFVYMDPPFSVAAKRVFKEYNSSVFNNADLTRLRAWLENFKERGIDFLVSYAECEEANYLSEGFFSTDVIVRRNIAGFSSRRQLSREILVSSAPIQV